MKIRTAIEDFLVEIEIRKYTIKTQRGYYDQQFNAILATLDALEKRVARLEDEVFKKRPGKTTERIEADVYVTQTSLQKVRDAFLRVFR